MNIDGRIIFRGTEGEMTLKNCILSNMPRPRVQPGTAEAAAVAAVVVIAATTAVLLTY